MFLISKFLRRRRGHNADSESQGRVYAQSLNPTEWQKQAKPNKQLFRAYSTVKKAIKNAKNALRMALEHKVRVTCCDFSPLLTARHQHSIFRQKAGAQLIDATPTKQTVLAAHRSALTLSQDRAGEYEGPTLGRAHGCKPEQVLNRSYVTPDSDVGPSHVVMPFLSIHIINLISVHRTVTCDGLLVMQIVWWPEDDCDPLQEKMQPQVGKSRLGTCTVGTRLPPVLNSWLQDCIVTSFLCLHCAQCRGSGTGGCVGDAGGRGRGAGLG